MKLRGLLVVAMVCLLGVASLAAPATAVPPESAGPPERGDIFFRVPTTLRTPNTGWFTAFDSLNGMGSGSLVQDGHMCPVGDVVDTEYQRSSPWHNGTILFTIDIVKRFTCQNGSGTFDIRMSVRVLNTGNTEFNWRVIGGSGDYAQMAGSGTGTGHWVPENNTVIDTYSGFLVIRG